MEKVSELRVKAVTGGRRPPSAPDHDLTELVSAKAIWVARGESCIVGGARHAATAELRGIEVSLAAVPNLRVHWIIARKIVAELLEPGLPCRVLPLGLAPALPSVAALTVLVASTTNGSFQ